MAEDDSQKTEEPTAKKISKARSEGNVAQSRDLTSWVYLMTATLLIVLAFPPLFGQIVRILEMMLIAASEPLEAQELRFFLQNDVMLPIAKYFTPIMFAFMLVAVASSVGQFGFLVATKKLVPKLENLSLKKGIKRMLSAKSLIEFAKGILKIFMVAAIAIAILVVEFENISQIMYLDIDGFVPIFLEVFIKVMSGILIFLFFLALFDVAWQNHSHKKQLMMSRKEIKDEQKTN